MTSLNQDMALKLLKNLMMSFKNCIRIRMTIFWRLAYYLWLLPRFCEQAFSLGDVELTHYLVIFLIGKTPKLGLNKFLPLFHLITLFQLSICESSHVIVDSHVLNWNKIVTWNNVEEHIKSQLRASPENLSY